MLGLVEAPDELDLSALLTVPATMAAVLALRVGVALAGLLGGCGGRLLP
ncbi:hypothetical protein [Streptomyces sp. TLI_105]|nr:hypothetical protein [Streptomyces sp. TLI_105]